MRRDKDELFHDIVRAVGARPEAWPGDMGRAIQSGKKLGYTMAKHDSVSRHTVFTFLIVNGANPATVLEWLHRTQRVEVDALQELVTTLRALRGGTHRKWTWTIARDRFGRVCAQAPRAPPRLPATCSDADVEAAAAYARTHVAANRAEGAAGSDDAALATFASERTAYFCSTFPLESLARLLHRTTSPFHLREVAVGKTMLRARPVLDLSLLKWATAKNPTSLHLGPAHDEAQEPRLGARAEALGTELCLEIDDLPQSLGSDLSSELRWVWLHNALGIVLDVLRAFYGVERVLTFASGNRGPHVWLLDPWILAQNTATRRAFLEELHTPERQAWWDASGVLSRCEVFYAEVVCLPREEGGFGLQGFRSPTEIIKLTWPKFDKDVALDAKHLHRLPFSVHEKTSRIAIPFADLSTMPTCLEDQPRVDDPQLAERLKAPLQALQAVVAALDGDALLRPAAEVGVKRDAVPTSAWALRYADKKRKWNAGDSQESNAALTIKLAPLRLDTNAVREWRDLLVATAADATADPRNFDADLTALARTARAPHPPQEQHEGMEVNAWRERFRREVGRLDLLIAANVATLTNVVVADDAGARLAVRHPEIGQRNFMKTIASVTRHRITGQLLELDVSGAHPAAAWSAMVLMHGADEAARRSPCLRLVVTDRAAAVARLLAEYKGATPPTPAEAKTKLLRSLNQSKDDKTHAMRKPFLKSLVEERDEMEVALLAFPPLQNVVDKIREKARAGGKSSTLLSLLMQAAENHAVVEAIPELAALGWKCEAVLNDALLLRAHRDGLHAEAHYEVARKAMQDVAGRLGMNVSVKIDHRPRV